ncbi:transglutaminase-like domain-containing protein [Wenxinia marina]|uniref:Transglutaminase-like enzyme, putative cysteine protease n=1 Tax=Wenxinia marina DSM 24838 TaxID=1123501 RepID=A0A0D0Q8N4_9RHOB|nr:transglutaminase-like domain-containing protein [Wenxinia marina]KIQ70744.1 Transglutaminase-like enzyme, putative cysteine protease [Wenxinia marina DSM 24838]GGL80484.1 transglutaminase [Wenxinia marina]
MLTRRSVLASGAAAALVALPRGAAALYAPTPGDWRTFRVTTRVVLPRSGAPAQAWVPVPSLAAEGWSRPGETTWSAPDAQVALVEDAEQDLSFVHAVWDAADADAVLEVVSTVATRDRRVDPGADTGATLTEAERARYTAPTDLIPTDGIVRETAESIVGWTWSDRRKAERLYNWVVESTERDPETRGCGLGDVASMLHTGDLTGKCADLNALFVGLARAAGLPARDLYGLRVAPSAFDYRSLGAGSSDVTRAQHCRAEVFLDGAGWVPADPADVRKVALEEPPAARPLADPVVADVRAALFGASEGNWIAFNDAHDVVLPGASFGPVPFLMYPQAEVGGAWRDELSPDTFAYTITAEEVG